MPATHKRYTYLKNAPDTAVQNFGFAIYKGCSVYWPLFKGWAWDSKFWIYDFQNLVGLLTTFCF